MIAATLLAAAVLAPSGTTATIQGAPVCLPVAAQPGHSYALSVGSSPGVLSVVRDGNYPMSTLPQVPASWVSFGGRSGDSTQVTLSVPAGAASGPYWSQIMVSEGGSAPDPGSPGASLGAAATTGFMFTVGQTPPPPCDALTLAQSTGQFPPWPTRAFATSSWKQVLDREKGNGPAAPAVQYAPAASQGSPAGVGPNRDGWVVIAIIGAIILLLVMRRRSS